MLLCTWHLAPNRWYHILFSHAPTHTIEISSSRYVQIRVDYGGCIIPSKVRKFKICNFFPTCMYYFCYFVALSYPLVFMWYICRRFCCRWYMYTLMHSKLQCCKISVRNVYTFYTYKLSSAIPRASNAARWALIPASASVADRRSAGL